MGNLFGTLFATRTPQDVTNREINKILKIDRVEQRRIYKILLLGTGGCGKSTFLKQMKIIENEAGNLDDPFPLKERQEKWRTLVFFNIYSGVRVILKQMENLRIAFESPGNERRGKEILDIPEYAAFVSKDSASIRLDYALKIKELWSDQGIQTCFSRRSEYQLEDSVQYFLDNLSEVLEENYVPSVEHVLHVRVKTTTIYTQDIPMKDSTLRMIDVGGQRDYRDKWIHYFDRVVSIIFITSLSEFNLKLEEDQNVSRFDESLGLFQKIVENRFFLNTCVILFLNKKDLLQQKLDQGVDFTEFFEDFDPDDYDDPNEDHPKEAEYMRDRYLERVKDGLGDERSIYSHITCATDTQNVNIIWDVVKCTILESAMVVIALN